MWFAITQKNVDPNKIVEAWSIYVKEDNNVMQLSKKEFLKNMGKKILDQDFLGDMDGLQRPGLVYKIAEAYEFVKEELLKKI
jgi:hypothetical protein